VPISLDEAKKIIADAMNGEGDTSPGWDGRLTAAVLVVFGDGSAKIGRELLVKLASDKINKG